MNQLNERFLLAAIPEPVTCCGLDLRPLSLGHMMLLERFESAFLDKEKIPTTGDLLMGAAVCSCTFVEGIALLKQPDLQSIVTKWAKRLRRRRMFKPRWNIGKAMELFCDYLIAGAGTMYLPGQFTDGQGKQSEAPWTAQLLTVALTAGIRLHEAFDMSLALLRWIVAAHTERESLGRVQLCDPAEVRATQLESDEFFRSVMANGGRWPTAANQ